MEIKQDDTQTGKPCILLYEISCRVLWAFLVLRNAANALRNTNIKNIFERNTDLIDCIEIKIRYYSRKL